MVFLYVSGYDQPSNKDTYLWNVSTFKLVKVSDLYGLILVGGQSKRMGEEKALIDYHGKPQLDHLLELMNGCLMQTFVSKRPHQMVDFKRDVIEDAFEVCGPLNGLLSAHKCFPDKAWLVIAVDMPLVNSRTLRKLIESRDQNKLATAYECAKLPEPLAAIWEPAALAKLQQNLESDMIVYPRKFLIENEIKVVQPIEDSELANVNEPQDLKRIQALFNRSPGG